MNKFLKVSLISVLIIIVILIAIYVKMFIIGSKGYEDIIIDKVVVGNENIVIKGNISSSNRAFKNFKYTQVGDELYIVIRSVLVSKKYKEGDFEIKIPVRSDVEVKYIHLSDDKNTKVIYNNE